MSLPPDHTWWAEQAGEEGDSEGGEGEQEDVSRVYRAHFLHTEHFTFTGATHGESGETETEELPLLASVKYYSDGHVRSEEIVFSFQIESQIYGSIQLSTHVRQLSKSVCEAESER